MGYTKKCEYCKKEFNTKKADKKFCSTECYHKVYMVARYKKIGTPFLRLRFEIFKRDNFTCQYCGRNVKEDKIKLEAEHINPITNGGENTFDNLITSCRECNQGKGDVLLTQLKNQEEKNG